MREHRAAGTSAGSFRSAVIRRRTNLVDVRCLPRVRSTNAYAAALIRDRSLQLPGAVVASQQTVGRGQHDRRWWSDAGCLTVTYAFRMPDITSADELPFPLLVGLAVLRVIRLIADDPAKIQVKWPNDVLAAGRKLAGVLCERHDKVILAGVGVNIAADIASAPSALRQQMTSLDALTAAPPDRQTVLIEVWTALSLLLQDIADRGEAAWREPYEAAMFRRDDRLRVCMDDADDIVGVCTGVSAEGNLCVQTQAGPQQIRTGRIDLTDSQKHA